jgi:hypothetical protein
MLLRDVGFEPFLVAKLLDDPFRFGTRRKATYTHAM